MWRKYPFNAKGMMFRRKQLRKDSTDSEQIIWEKIRNKKLGYKFFRQYSVEGYVVDFYCAQKRLAIEIDGKIHQFTKVYDNFKTRYLEGYGIKTVRFSNEIVNTKIDDVIKSIRDILASPS